MPERYLIVGLGNPGKKYENTRHNVGFHVVDELARRHGFGSSKQERKALVSEGTIQGKRVLLAKPQTYMNLSGEAVRALVDFYKIPLDALLVVHDDLDTPLDTLKLRKGGGHGGQNGVRNIIQHLGTQNFARVRFGIGRPPGRMDAVAYVLTPFTGDDAITAKLVTERAASAAEVWLAEGIETAMTRFNGDGAPQKPKTDPQAELALAQRAHELAPQDPKPLEKMAALRKQLGQLDHAAETHLQIAALYAAQGNLNATVKQLEQAASLRPASSDVQQRIAELYLQRGDSKKAVQRHLIFADYLLSQGAFAEALQALQAALAINPQHPRAMALHLQVQQQLTQ